MRLTPDQQRAVEARLRYALGVSDGDPMKAALWLSVQAVMAERGMSTGYLRLRPEEPVAGRKEVREAL